MKAIPFINTMLDDQYRVFILESFNHESIQKYFESWNNKDMISWNKFTTIESTISFEFYGEGNTYKIKNPRIVGNTVHSLPYPKNLEEFICDCQRCLVDLRWNSDIISTMNRVIFMEQSKIEAYNKELLIKIEKE